VPLVSSSELIEGLVGAIFCLRCILCLQRGPAAAGVCSTVGISLGASSSVSWLCVAVGHWAGWGRKF
jgi:hypothetical protein